MSCIDKDFKLQDVCFSSFPVQAIRKCLRAINESRAQKRKVRHIFFSLVF